MNTIRVSEKAAGIDSLQLELTAHRTGVRHNSHYFGPSYPHKWCK